MQIEGKLWKDKLRAKIAEVAFYSKNFEDFLQRCTECGIEYVYKLQNKVKLKFRLSGEGQQKFTRADTLGENYTAEKIAEQIEQIQKAQAVLERLSEKKKPEKPVATAPVTTTKTKPTAEVSAPTTPPSESIHFIADTVLARMREKGITPPPPAPKPTQTVAPPKPVEVKAPEKKEDPWKAIRGMGRANEIIADLEAGGVMSFSELSGFFFNTPHSDDHTTERADLKKKFTAIDTLIAKMKHRDELEPVYKEYQGKSGWSQSRFKKKNAATIEDYEQTVKYIKEHIKKYAVDGKPPTMLDLLEKSNKLKSKWNRLNVEHTAFLTKRETAKKYTRQVRQYINEQQMKREREKSRQRTQAKHRNKNTLE